jgi:phosphoglycerate dehydrogenase-like enzyme
MSSDADRARGAPSGSTRVACLDVWAPGVRDIVKRVAPPELELTFATSYDEAHQMQLVKDTDVIFAGWAAVTKPMLEHATRLKFIEKFGIGYDRIDVDAARARGIGVAITAGSNAAPVSELAVGLMLAVYRRIAQVDRALREGRWLKSEMREVCYQLAGKTVGIFGFGNIGQKVAQRLAGFECSVIYHDARRADTAIEAKLNARFVSRDELFSESDVLSLHAPFIAETANVVNAASIKTMKDGAILINTARGELVDEKALFDALTSGKLRGAGLDAFAIEPVEPGNPLLTLDQVVATPHVGGAVIDNVENVARHAIGNIMRVLNGEALRPQDVVVPVTAASSKR